MKRPVITEDMRERLNQALSDLWADDGLSDFVELLDAQKLAICEADQLSALREENEERSTKNMKSRTLLAIARNALREISNEEDIDRIEEIAADALETFDREVEKLN